MTWVAVAFGVALAAVHLFAGTLRFLHGVPRSRWLSAAGGVSVAYVFIHLLPELATAQESLNRSSSTPLGFFERHVYLVALLGLGAFYGLERYTKKSCARGASDTSAPFFVSVGSFAFYNVVIGYLLVRKDRSVATLAMYAVALGLHFVVNDFALREHHASRYDRVGRFLLAGAVVVGALLGAAMKLPELLVAVATALVAGAIVLNALKEELPDERESRFWAFAIGAAAYAALLVATAASADASGHPPPHEHAVVRRAAE